VDFVGVNVCCIDGTEVLVECLVVPYICASVVGQQTIKVAKSFSYLKGLKLSDPVVSGKSRIDVLLGLDYYYEFVTGVIRRGKINEPIALERPFFTYEFCDMLTCS